MRVTGGSRQDVLLMSLKRYFKDPEKMLILRNMVNGQGPVSLRLIEFFVTNYAKKNNIEFHTEDKQLFNIYLNYKQQLKAYSKEFFDPFCRHERSTITDSDGNALETTVGQANFFKWVINNNILHWTNELRSDIESHTAHAREERDSLDDTQRSRTGRRRRRGEISQSATRRLNRTEGEFVVSFK